MGNAEGGSGANRRRVRFKDEPVVHTQAKGDFATLLETFALEAGTAEQQSNRLHIFRFLQQYAPVTLDSWVSEARESDSDTPPSESLALAQLVFNSNPFDPQITARHILDNQLEYQEDIGAAIALPESTIAPYLDMLLQTQPLVLLALADLAISDSVGKAERALVALKLPDAHNLHSSLPKLKALINELEGCPEMSVSQRCAALSDSFLTMLRKSM